MSPDAAARPDRDTLPTALREGAGAPSAEPRVLRTTVGDYPLHRYRLRLAGREWSILHTGAVLTHRDEADYFQAVSDRLPYGVALWPSALALARGVADRADALRGSRVLELGAGTGLPGIVAASCGARVVQTDGQEIALTVCRWNGERNGMRNIEYRLADWARWDDDARYPWILGSDILYGESTHPHLRRIFERNLAPGGRVLLGDPFRAASFQLLEELEAAGWGVSATQWKVGEESAPRPVGLFELVPPSVHTSPRTPERTADDST